jgi:UDP-GlcNAc:undecaprenyl-phosphate/decaprenyl-phosphate GlcNAc-1-phosphate transferase
MREYLLTLCVAAAVTYLLTPIARRVAIRWHAMTAVRDRDVHAIPTPRLGGLAMLGGLTAALIVARELPLLREIFAGSQDVGAVLSGAAVICVLGAIDDKWGLDALTKLAGQVLAAGVMVLQGLQLLWLPIPRSGPLLLPTQTGVILTVLIVVVTINAVNFVDGLDGLAAGVVAIGASAFFAFSYLLAVEKGFSRAAAATLLSAALVGICVGFLPHNFNPAQIFMGDSGSMLIGLLLAGATISLTGQVDPSAARAPELLPALLPLLLPFVVVALPLADLMIAVIRRTRAGRSPFAPDKQHLHHRLLEIGHSHIRAVLIMYLWSGLIAFGAVAMAVLDGPGPLFAIGGVVAVLAVVTLNLPRLRRHLRPGAG